MTLKVQLEQLMRERFGLELDEHTSTRVQGLALRQEEAERLEPWLSALRQGDPSTVVVRAVLCAATNGQTYFMRDLPQLAAVEEWLALRHREVRRPLQVWSAGCSTGEEAYTLSILGQRLRVPLRITGSDVSAESLERARRGIYAEWSLRHVPDAERDVYFVRRSEGYEVRPRVRQAVSFSLHNLATARPLKPERGDAPWDLILCRNVLIYFAPQARLRVLTSFEAALKQEGALVLSSGESLRGLATQLRPRKLAGAFVFTCDKRFQADEPGALDIPQNAWIPPTKPGNSTFPPRSPTRPTSIPPEGYLEGTRPDLRPLLNTGNKLLLEHSFHMALDQYQSALALDGLSFETYVLSAIVHLKQGGLSEAKACLRSALFLEPKLWPAEYLLAGIMARESRRHEQLAALSRAENYLLRRDVGPAFVSDTTGIEPICYNREQALRLCQARLRSLRKGIA